MAYHLIHIYKCLQWLITSTKKLKLDRHSDESRVRTFNNTRQVFFKFDRVFLSVISHAHKWWKSHLTLEEIRQTSNAKWLVRHPVIGIGVQSKDYVCKAAFPYCDFVRILTLGFLSPQYVLLIALCSILNEEQNMGSNFLPLDLITTEWYRSSSLSNSIKEAIY